MIEYRPLDNLDHLDYLQLSITRGHDCQSIGKLLNIIGHFAFIVSLENRKGL